MHIYVGDLSEDDSGDSSADEITCVSRLSPDGYLLLEEDPILWIQNNPTHLLSVRRLKLDYCWRGGKGIIGDSIGNLTELTHLSIHCVKTITYLPNILSSLRNLRELDLRNCEELPPNLGDLESLTSLSICYCTSIKSLPDSLAKLSKLTKLYISFCDNLQELPANFGELESLTHFTFYNCSSIKSLPSSVAKLSKLTSLKMGFCDNLQDLPANLGELRSLTHLFIEFCRSLKECPSNLNNVVDLSLKGCCSIQSLPRGLSNLDQLYLPLCINTQEETLANLEYFVSLRHLKFWDCLLHEPCAKELPANLDKLPRLSVLDIQDTRIKCLPSSITKLSQLRLLRLPYDFILETLPYHLDESLVISVDNTHVRKTWKELKNEMEVSLFPTVRVDPSGYLPLAGDPTPWMKNNYTSHSMVQILDLELRGDRAENITDSIAELSELTHLYISGGYLSQLPLTFTRITHISLCDCEFQCDMKSFFDSLEKLSTLKSFRLNSWCDTKFPEHMDLPVSLRHLSLRYRGINFVPLPDSMTKLSNLKALHLSGCIQSDSLPENLNLEKLKLVDCNIKSLPRGLRHVEILHTSRICKCDKLGTCLNQLVDVETFSVTCHSIKFLPSVAGLYNLQELQLKDCFSIKKLPPNLDEMVNLCTLNVSGTRIKSLPCSISKLPKLQCLILPKCFQPGSLPLKFRNQSTVSFDDTDDKYYEDMGYYDSDHETSSEVDDDTTITIEGGKEVVSEVSEEGIISQQQISPHQLLNQSDAIPVLGDSHGSGANHPIGENSHHTSFSYQDQETEIFPFESKELTADNRLLNLQKPCSPSSQHALQPEQMASMTSEIEHGLPPNFQHDFSSSTGNNILVSENGQNEDNLHREGDYAKGQEKKKEVTREAIINLDPRNVTVVAAANELKDSNSNGRNDLIGENSHHAISCSQNQETEILSSGVCDEMIIESSSNFQETVSFGKNSQHAVQNGQMDILNSETEHEITFLNQDISSCDKKDVSRSGNNLVTFENKQIDKNSQSEGEKNKKHKKEITLKDIQRLIAKTITLEDAAKVFSALKSTLKRRLKELKITWRRIANKKKHNTELPSSSKNSSQVNLVPVGHEYAMEELDGANQHVFPDQVSYPNSNVIDNSTINTTVETVEVPMVETQLCTDDHEIGRERLNGVNSSTLSNSVQKSGSSCSFVVKATHKEDTVRFDSFSTTIVEIREEVAANLELELGKFKIKYEDSDKEWMLMTTNKHLKYARNLLDSSGSNILRLSIIDS